ncbi:FAD-dependent oxidoreductase [Janibacter melonis]|uniref:NAD(P)/FAD-dependent oxidoreductase n=1 Tax=Janibacter melonis TaxID=262209 RepID=UPI001E569DFF|nr:FAD-dependent oxidoreductase [Janibacter melonis]MCB5991340.1 FAD-dependent oxidoreductase [Janibacter melonis]
MTSELQVVVIGGGECGARVAHDLATSDLDARVVLVGRESRAPYERPPLSKSVLVDDDPRPVEPYRDGRLDVEGLEVLAGRTATSLDLVGRTVELGDGMRLGFDRLVLATGAQPRRLTGLPAAALTLRTFEDALVLRDALRPGAHLLVVGAGLVGLEVAASARTRGAQVTVVEAAERALGRAVPEPVARVLVERHEAEGVDLRLGTTVASAGAGSGGWRVELSDGSVVTPDVVLQAVGSMPETGLAQAAGIEVDDGVVVDAAMRTSAPGVWAAGDCCAGPVPVLGRRQRLESWRMAHDQAAVAAASVRGEEVSITAVPWFWSDQYDLSLQVSGMAAAATRWVERPRPDGTVVHLGLDADGVLVCAAGAGRAAVAKDVRMAERLVAAGARPDPDQLADPAVQLRSLLG